jgi:15-cis-phytoene synthase
MSRDTSFYYSFLVLPPRKRRAIVAVWDFCRAVDDAVDVLDAGRVPPIDAPQGGSTEGPPFDGAQGAPSDSRGALAMWRAELNACYGGREPSTAQGKALKPYIREFSLPRQPFEDLIGGVEMDLLQVRYPTFHALAEYCRRVASTVGLICIEIFGYRDPRTPSYAVNLGMALQLTNIIRDIAADLGQGRLYLPAEDMERFGVTEDDLRTGTVTGPVRDLLRFECERARYYYRCAADELPAVDARSLLAAEIMGGIYFGILQRIERAGYDVFTRRIRVPRPARALIALRLWIRALLRR